MEAYELGLGEPMALSAEHGEGMAELPPRCAADRGGEARPGAKRPPDDVDVDDGRRPTAAAHPPRPAPAGRRGGPPNAGKSTLVNKILGEDRLLTGPEAGITRDAISVRIDWDGTPMRIFDTAGMRKKAKVQEKLEKLSVADGLRAVKFAEVVVVLLDAAIPFESRTCASPIWPSARAAPWWSRSTSGTSNRQAGQARELQGGVRAPAAAARARRWSPSRPRRAGLDRLRAAVLKAHEVWNRRVPPPRSTAGSPRWSRRTRRPRPAGGGSSCAT
jgi:GTP-binding protein